MVTGVSITVGQEPSFRTSEQHKSTFPLSTAITVDDGVGQRSRKRLVAVLSLAATPVAIARRDSGGAIRRLPSSPVTEAFVSLPGACEAVGQFESCKATDVQILKNKWRRAGREPLLGPGIPFPSTDADRVAGLLSRCPAAMATPLVQAADLARAAGIAALAVKDERGRMGLGSFKALGAAYVVACDAAARAADAGRDTLQGATYVTASAGNHGLSVAAGAAMFGARAVIYIAETVPESFAHRLRDKGAEVVRAGADYEASMAAAGQAAETEGWTLLSDSSWEGYLERPYRLMEGYLALMAETVEQSEHPPSHIFVQAGVGGLAGAVAAFARSAWGDAPRIVVVEPEAAPALYESIRAGRAVATQGPVSAMGRLDCKEPSLIALQGLARDADLFVTISEAEAHAAMTPLADACLATTPSGGAGVAAVLASGPLRADLQLDGESRVLTFLTEAPEA